MGWLGVQSTLLDLESIMRVTMLGVTESSLTAIMELLMVAIMAVLMVILMAVLLRAIMTVLMTTMIPPKNIRLTFALPRCSESKRGDEKTADVLHPLPDPRARKGVPL